MKIACSAFWRHALEPRLPGDLEAAWFQTVAEAEAAVVGAKAVLLDLLVGREPFRRILEKGRELEWVASSFAGTDRYPQDYMAERGLVFTHGGGINAVPVAEWAVMGVYALAKGLPGLVRMHDRKEWRDAPYGTVEVASSKVLVIGYGYIGKEIARQLTGVGAAVSVVRSRADPDTGVLGPDDWRPRLGEFDFVILAAPGTEATRHMIGAAELRAMKKGAGLINIGRGSLIDQRAFIEAMAAGEIGGALLDPTEPEPLPADHPLWDAENTIVTAHLSGRSQTTMPTRAADLFLDNLARFREGRELRNVVDPGRGY